MIPVIWGVDSNYVFPAFVVMKSILSNSGENYHFFILSSDDITEKVNRFSNILRHKHNNFVVEIIHINEEIFGNISINHKHLSKAAYFRLLAPKLITDFDKAIYLDCDLLVNGDLEELFQLDIGDNYIAGVKDCHLIGNSPEEVEHQLIIGLPTTEKYINSGVMLLNLKRMQQDNIFAKFLSQLQKNNPYEDQDVLNVCCYPYIHVIPLKYNLFHFYSGRNISYLKHLPFETRDFAFDTENPFIIHMGGPYKPWFSSKVKGATLWWHFAQSFTQCEEYKTFHSMLDAEKENGLTRIIQRCNYENTVVIWGFGKNGKYIYDILKKNIVKSKILFTDNNQELWKLSYHDAEVSEPERLYKSIYKTYWIISCQAAWREITEQLIQKGVQRCDIVKFFNKFDDKFYLLALDEKSFIDEIDDITLMEYAEIDNLTERKEHILQLLESENRDNQEYNYFFEKYNLQYWYGNMEKNED